jgi:hypothetical protein
MEKFGTFATARARDCARELSEFGEGERAANVPPECGVFVKMHSDFCSADDANTAVYPHITKFN